MTLNNAFPLPWRAAKVPGDGWGIYDDNGDWTGIHVNDLEMPEDYDAKEIANAIVAAMNPATHEEDAEEALNDLVEFWHFPEEALKKLPTWELIRMKQKIDEAGWDAESASIRAEMYADELGIELEDEDETP
jgi:hypothetical protein